MKFTSEYRKITKSFFASSSSFTHQIAYSFLLVARAFLRLLHCFFSRMRVVHFLHGFIVVCSIGDVSAFISPPVFLASGRQEEEPTVIHATRNGETACDDGTLDITCCSVPPVAPMNPLISRSSFFAATAVAAAMIPAAVMARPSSQESNAAGSVKSVDSSTSASTENAIASTTEPNLAVDQLSSLQESISGFVAGGALATTKTLVKYPLDTVTVRLQVPNSGYSVQEMADLFRGSYNGVAFSLLSNIPAGSVFFAVKDAAKSSLKNSAWTGAAPKWVTTTLAVGAALIPYWAIRNPSEVIKVRQQAGVAGYGEGVSAWEAMKLTYNETQQDGGSALDGIGSFYTGYWENIIYGLPADVIKFVAYESLTGGRKSLSPVEGAKAGAFATAAAQLLTTPLDVVRNRLMTNNTSSSSSASRNDNEGEVPKTSYVERLIRLGKEEGLAGLFAGAAPRVGKAFLSGAIQFATYEETKQSIAGLLKNR